ncbi:hypothetical protein Sjap_024626 [Stephania japonica]|uniref:Uncharacterized protein n=1 Tax=Stephania japonica TaxID=461633 RepID=A0AAP0EMD5_9MAGN
MLFRSRCSSHCSLFLLSFSELFSVDWNNFFFCNDLRTHFVIIDIINNLFIS